MVQRVLGSEANYPALLFLQGPRHTGGIELVPVRTQSRVGARHAVPLVYRDQTLKGGTNGARVVLPATNSHNGATLRPGRCL